MKTVKRVSSDWDIYSGTVTINGNLVVVGQSTQVGSVNTFIADNVITLAAGQGGLVDAGIEVDRRILSDLAINDPAAFKSLVDVAKANVKN